MIASLVPAALLPLVFVGWFVFKVWFRALWMARSAVLAIADLRYNVGAWARRRSWAVRADGPFLFTRIAEAEQVLACAQGVVAGCPCAVLYCYSAESKYVACFLRLPRRLPGPIGTVLRPRHRWALRRAAGPDPPDGAERNNMFDRRFRVCTAEPDRLALLTAPVRAALLRLAAVGRLRRLRIAGDLVVVEVDGWVLGEKLDALVDVLRAMAAGSGSGQHPALPVHPGAGRRYARPSGLPAGFVGGQ